MSENDCPCGSEKSYELCCGALIDKKQKANSPAACMRSRYTAYALAHIDYIKQSHHPESREEMNWDQTKLWAEGAKWKGLKIIDEQMQSNDVGTVEFVAKYEFKGALVEHHEKSVFKKVDDEWFFHDGEVFHSPIRRSEDKVGRNDLCSCGSGKKYKKCCLQKI